jgi:general secretion pathway protein A
MLREHYKLAVQPFGVTPDPRFLYLSATHREAMASLLYGIRSERGFTALIAAPGMGKTTLLMNLLYMLDGDTKTAFLFQTLCEPREFLSALLADLRVEDDGTSITRMQARLNEYLLRESHHGRPVVVIIDEAQNLNEQVLEVVRTLSNFETATKKLLHIVLAGQPQLAEKLNSRTLTQLRQRISIVARLAPFNARETRDYIEHRLKVAGHASCKPLFTDQAYAMIAEQSQGVPRDINNLCFNAMSLGCASKCSIVDRSMVQETVNDLDLRTVAASPKNSNERSGRPSHFSGGVFSSAKWRQEALVAIAVLASLVWPISRLVVPARQQLLPERSARTSQPETNHHFEMVAAAAVPVPKGRKEQPLRAAPVARTDTPRTRTRWDKSQRAEEAPGTADESRSKVNQNTSVTGTNTTEYDHTSSNDELEFNLLLEGVGLTERMHTNGIPMSQQPTRDIQSVPDQNLAPLDSQVQKGIL